MRNLTWACHACGDTRPDKLISVYKRRWHYGNGAVVGENWRYCNDRPECLEMVRAKPKTLLTLYGLSSTVRLVESTSYECWHAYREE